MPERKMYNPEGGARGGGYSAYNPAGRSESGTSASFRSSRSSDSDSIHSKRLSARVPERYFLIFLIFYFCSYIFENPLLFWLLF